MVGFCCAPSLLPKYTADAAGRVSINIDDSRCSTIAMLVNVLSTWMGASLLQRSLHPCLLMYVADDRQEVPSPNRLQQSIMRLRQTQLPSGNPITQQQRHHLTMMVEGTDQQPLDEEASAAAVQRSSRSINNTTTAAAKRRGDPPSTSDERKCEDQQQAAMVFTTRRRPR